MAPSLEERIVAALCRDGRADLASVAAEVDASVRTVRDRLETMEAEGAIGGYTARLDYAKLDCVTAVFELPVERDRVAGVTARLRDRPWSVTVYETTGPSSVFAVGRFTDEASLAERVWELHADPDVDGVAVSRVESIVRERDSPLEDG